MWRILSREVFSTAKIWVLQYTIWISIQTSQNAMYVIVFERVEAVFGIGVSKHLVKKKRLPEMKSNWKNLVNYISKNASIGEYHPFISFQGWVGCEVSCGGHHRQRGKTTTGSALDGAVFDIAQILAYLVHNMSRYQLYLGFGHFGWLPSFFGQ